MSTGNGRARTRGDRTATPGTLVLIGGGASITGAALGAFLEIARARDGARIIGLTTASSDPTRSARAWLADLHAAGATNVEIPIVRRREDACDARIARTVREADAIFLGGGDQVHLVATIGGTPVGDAVYDAFCRGVPVCGTSAGAAALTETTLAGGEIDIYGDEVEMYIGPGLGLLGCGALIDTHFAQRRRLHRLFVAIAGYPSLLGLGIDEDTALVVRGHSAEVRGKGGVTFVDGRTVSYDNASEITTGGQLTLSHLRVGLIGAGHRFDLERRELEALLDGRAKPPGAASELPQAKAMVGE